jgi:hypothetical protein
MAQQSFKHHYVPEWYQRRFLAPGTSAFKILDLYPEVFRKPNGSIVGRGREILEKGPNASFFKKDLYTVRWFGEANDDIERMLFGAIDKDGHRAIEAYLQEDWDTVHHTYWQMFEFMDALRLRTPKGLAFLRRVFEARSQYQLMDAMQRLRRMHCVMWAEGIMEILSAEQSSTKLLFSDHPVTLFNSRVFPADPSIPKGMDPLLDWTGTQTLFPFDRDHLFVLTHLEWARSAGKAKAMTKRTNARYFDTPMVRYDNCIRERDLSESQVHEVNYIIKARAHRYVAASSEADLYPERHLKTRVWNKLGKFLMPSKQLHMFGGDMIMKTGKGVFFFQDEFGRRPNSTEEYEAKVEKAQALMRDAQRIIAEHQAKQQAEDD